MAKNTYPILGKGEVLTAPVPLQTGGFKKDDIRDIDSAIERLTPQLEALRDITESTPAQHRLSNWFYFTIDLDYSYIAKSYYPHNLVNTVGWELVGSISWNQKKRDENKIPEKQSRRLYLRGTQKSLENVHKALVSKNIKKKGIQNELVRLDAIYATGSTSKIEKVFDIKKDETVELIIHSMLQSDWNECLSKLKSILLFENYPEFLFDWLRGGKSKGPRFLPAKVNKDTLLELSRFNPLRSVRSMPKVSFPRIDIGTSHSTSSPPSGSPLRSGSTAEIGVFDGGVDSSIPHLGKWVIPVDLTPEPKNLEALFHGTAVCGAVLYGNYDPSKSYPTPEVNVKSFRVFPVPDVLGIDLDLYQIIDWIDQTVTNNPQIKTYVLSFGPDIPIDDNEIDPFTIKLDELAYERDVIFIVAAGNNGRLNPPHNRIQPPSDTINGIGVGAYKIDGDGKLKPTSYSCTGPGRCGNFIKPDVHAFGGNSKKPFNVFLANKPGKFAEVQGTSFAAPVVTSIAGNLIHRTDEPAIISPQTAKALLIHNAISEKEWDGNYGWGVIQSSPDDIMQCTDDKISIIYNGEVGFKKCLRLNIPFYNDLTDKGYVSFKYTFVFATGVAPGMPDEYSLAGTDISFRPHADVYTYTKNGKSIGTANINKDHNKVQTFLSQGAKQSLNPKTRSVIRNEQQRRDEGVWDTVEHCYTSRMQISSVHNPCIDVHALSRSDWEYGPESPGKIKYAAVVSIIFSSPNARIYQRIRERIPALVPVRLTTRTRIRQQHEPT